MKKQINIEGMSCSNCVRHVEEALNGVPGIGKVQVSLEGKYALVEVSAAVSNENLKEAIEDAGYDVSGIDII